MWYTIQIFLIRLLNILIKDTPMHTVVLASCEIMIIRTYIHGIDIVE